MKRYTDIEHKIVYQYDSTKKEIYRAKPLKVVFPEKINDIVSTIKEANNKNIPLYTRGAGTSVVGNGVPVSEGIIVSMEKMNKILELDLEGRIIKVESGITISKVNKYLEKYGFFIPAFPASHKFSTIGGNVSSNASGMGAIKYGVIGDYIKNIKVVLGNGEILNIGKHTQRLSMGLDLKKLFIGSFGLLGIIVEMEIAILPRPKNLKMYYIYENNIKQIKNFILNLYKQGIIPEQLEIIDRRISKLLLNKNKYYLEIYTNNKIEKACELNGKSIRKSMSPLLSSIRKKKISFDLSFSLKYLNKFDCLVEKLNEKDIFVGYYGHIGDGVFHLNICYNEESDKIDKIRKKIYNFIKEVNGGISGEHGYGYVHKDIAEKEMKKQLKYIRKIKNIFDPKHILNRGLEL